MSISKSSVAFGGRGLDILFGTDDGDLLSGGRGRDFLFGLDGNDELSGGRGRDFIFGGEGDDLIDGGRGSDFLFGGNGVDTIDGGKGADFLFGGSGGDTITTGKGHDVIAFAGDPFDGADVSGDDRQIIGNEDFVTDFDFHRDTYVFDGDDFDVGGHVSFVAVDATDPHAEIPTGSNFIVLLNSDNDDDPTTPFLAGTAANQIADLVDEDGAGFFVYFNSNLQINRLVWSENLNDANADLKIVSRQTDLTGQDAIDALALFGEDNFQFVSDGVSFEDEDDMAYDLAGTGEVSEMVPADVYGESDMFMMDDMTGLDLSGDMWA